MSNKRYRHRAALLIQDDRGRLLVKKSPPDRVAQGISIISTPGGGVHEDESESRYPTKREIVQAARREALEELGLQLKNPRVVGTHEGDLEEWWKDEQEKKRGVRFDGMAEHYVLASPGKKDMSKYNIEGDKFKGKFYTRKHLDPLMVRDANRKAQFAQFNQKQLEIIRGLRDDARNKGIKTAGLSNFKSLRSMRRAARDGTVISRRSFLKHMLREAAEASTKSKSEYARGMARDMAKLSSVAVKRDPAKWEAAKRQAKAKMGGKHSARAMQLATQIYKKNGGTYAGKKPTASSNKLKKWTKQKWNWSSGDTKGEGGRGVYLPARSSAALRSTKGGRAKLRRAAAEKRRATREGQQFSRHGLHVGKKRSQVNDS